ncbi:ATP-binding protein [Xanthomonas sacchari]|uniref:ATP-binding protein n=1 Tax=Xanthomonas sacchari TaxID=56458 RepID=UPI00225E50CC|nr:ATP-binding protein [Xanthomonas sacchari]MCW0422778.1 hypothetical protein [Xanthomonas sacchari]
MAIIDLSQNSHSGLLVGDFPDMPVDAVERAHVLETMSQIATGDTPVVFVEGPEGCGTTTLLAQFCIHEPSHCFYLFIKPASRFSYSVDYLRRVLAEQYCAYVGRELASDSAIDVAEYFSLQLSVRKKRGSKPIYFVVDGIQQIPTSEEKQISSIFTDVLPLGTTGFRFLIAGDADNLNKYIGGAKSKSYHVQKLSASESKLILKDSNIQDEHLDNLIKICKGLPGRLASVRKLLVSGLRSEELLSADPSVYPDFVGMEFARTRELDETQNLILATLAFSRYPLSSARLKEICQSTDQDLKKVLSVCGFLIYREDAGICEFESETYRRYAANSLEHLRHRSITAQIEYLAKNPNTPEAIQFLPAYHSSINQQQAIVDMLVPEHYTQLLKNTNSISSLRARAALGSRSAAELKQAQQIFQFSLQRSIFAEVAFASAFKSKIGALIAIGQPTKALDLALSSPTNEVQIQMLAEYAARKKEDSGTVDSQIVENIRELSEKVDFSGIREDLEALAENVAYFDADLAIAILDKTGLDKSEKDGRNEALVKLSLATVSTSKSEPSILEKTSSQVSDERHRSLISFISGYFGVLSLHQVTAITESMEVGRRIYFLRSVLAGPNIGPNALQIVEYALSQLINSSSYLPRMADLSDFATPLTYIDGANDKLREIIVKFDGQMGLVQESSGSVAKTSLGMKLAIGCSRLDAEETQQRILEIYYEVGDLASLEAKAECLAIMLKGLGQLHSFSELDAKEHISEVLREELNESIVSLLENTASHFEVVRRSLSAITEYDAAEAINLAEKLNTVAAKNHAYEQIAISLTSLPYNEERRSSLELCLDRITEIWIKDRAIVASVKSGVRGKDQVGWSGGLIGAVRRITNPAECCDALIAIIKSNIKNGIAIGSEVFSRFQDATSKIGSSIERAEMLYLGASALGRSDPERAQFFFSLAETARADANARTISSEKIVCICLSLILRASRVLIRHDHFDDEYLARYTRLCSQICDPIARVQYLADLATKCVCENKTDLAKKIIQDSCSPIFMDVSDPYCREQIARAMFTPLFLTKGKSALPNISSLDQEERDERLSSTVKTIIRKISDSDHWADGEENTSLSLSDAEDCILLIEEMTSDVYISSSVRQLVTALVSKASKGKITSQQRVSLKERLLRIVREKLPAPDGVKHEGYLVEVEAYIARLSDSHVWADLQKRASAINNLADRVLVNMEIAKSMPGRMVSDARELLSQVKQDISGIPSPYDRYGRLESFIEAARQIDPLMTRAAIKDAMSFSFYLDNTYVASRARRKLLDTAEQIDPKMLDELIAEIDDDPARDNARAELSRQAKVQKVRRKISSAKSENDSSDLDREVLPSAAWKSVGSLISRRAEPLVPEHLNGYVAACGEWDLEDSFPVLSWYIENVSRRLMRQEDVFQKLSPLWEILMLSAELAISIMYRVNNSTFSPMGHSSSNGIIIDRISGQEDASNFLRSWLSSADGCSGDIVFCDPYFSPSDIDLIRIIYSERPFDTISVITSRRSLQNLDEKAFELAWNRSLDQDPPSLDVIGISDVGDDRSPVHDRWLLMPGRGLRLGTSFSGLGSRLSEISELDDIRANELMAYLSRYVRREREVDGRRVTYLSQTL